ncbi:MAG: hypothetical protein ACLQRH_11290 [Acidimicrobiales bacterium]
MCAMVLALTACASGSSPPDDPTTGPTPPPTSPTRSLTDAATEMLAGYRAMRADLVIAARTSDFQSPRLARHATGNVSPSRCRVWPGSTSWHRDTG